MGAFVNGLPLDATVPPVEATPGGAGATTIWMRTEPARRGAGYARGRRRGASPSTPVAEASALLEEGDARRVCTHSLEVEKPEVFFMYPGGGAQYFKMGRDLHADEPVFRARVDAGLALLKSRHGVDLAPVFLAEEIDKDGLSKYQKALELGVADKIKIAMTGDKEWRSIFLRDSNKLVSSAALKNPRITDGEVLALSTADGSQRWAGKVSGEVKSEAVSLLNDTMAVTPSGKWLVTLYTKRALTTWSVIMSISS